MYTALLQVIIYQLAKYEKDPIKNGREIAERRKWERNNNKKEIRKKRQYNNRKVFRLCRQTLMKGQWREIQITNINLTAKLQDLNV